MQCMPSWLQLKISRILFGTFKTSTEMIITFYYTEEGSFLSEGQHNILNTELFHILFVLTFIKGT